MGQTVLVKGTPGKTLPCGKVIEIPIGWGSSSGTQVSGSAPAGGIGYASLQRRAGLHSLPLLALSSDSSMHGRAGAVAKALTLPYALTVALLL